MIKTSKPGFKTLKKIYPGRWMEGIFAALDAFMANYAIQTVAGSPQSACNISETVLAIASKRPARNWDVVKRNWLDQRFLATIHGLIIQSCNLWLASPLGVLTYPLFPLLMLQLYASDGHCRCSSQGGEATSGHGHLLRRSGVHHGGPP